MSRIVTFEGKKHSFPDGATDEEIRSALEEMSAPKGTTQEQQLNKRPEEAGGWGKLLDSLTSAGAPAGGAVMSNPVSGPDRGRPSGLALGVAGGTAVMDPVGTARAIGGSMVGESIGERVGRYLGWPTVGKVVGGLAGGLDPSTIPSMTRALPWVGRRLGPVMSKVFGENPGLIMTLWNRLSKEGTAKAATEGALPAGLSEDDIQNLMKTLGGDRDEAIRFATQGKIGAATPRVPTVPQPPATPGRQPNAFDADIDAAVAAAKAKMSGATTPTAPPSVANMTPASPAAAEAAAPNMSKAKRDEIDHIIDHIMKQHPDVTAADAEAAAIRIKRKSVLRTAQEAADNFRGIPPKVTPPSALTPGRAARAAKPPAAAPTAPVSPDVAGDVAGASGKPATAAMEHPPGATEDEVLEQVLGRPLTAPAETGAPVAAETGAPTPAVAPEAPVPPIEHPPDADADQVLESVLGRPLTASATPAAATGEDLTTALAKKQAARASATAESTAEQIASGAPPAVEPPPPSPAAGPQAGPIPPPAPAAPMAVPPQGPPQPAVAPVEDKGLVGEAIAKQAASNPNRKTRVVPTKKGSREVLEAVDHDTAIDMKPIESRGFTHYGYDPQSKTLALTFKDGTTYHYPGVNEADVNLALNGPHGYDPAKSGPWSKGKAFLALKNEHAGSESKVANAALPVPEPAAAAPTAAVTPKPKVEPAAPPSPDDTVGVLKSRIKDAETAGDKVLAARLKKKLADATKGAGTGPKAEGTVEPLTSRRFKPGDVPHEAGYVYHQTSPDGLRGIAQTGLEPRVSKFTRAPSKSAAISYSGTAHDATPEGAFLAESEALPENVLQEYINAGRGVPDIQTKSVVTRVKKADAGKLKRDLEKNGWLYSDGSPVPANKIEFLGSDKQWHPMSDLKASEPSKWWWEQPKNTWPDLNKGPIVKAPTSMPKGAPERPATPALSPGEPVSPAPSGAPSAPTVKPTKTVTLTPRKPDGSVGPYENMSSVEQLKHVIYGNKPAVLFDGPSRDMNMIAQVAKDHGLAVDVAPIEGVQGSSVLRVGKDGDKLRALQEATKDDELATALGYTKADLKAYKDRAGKLYNASGDQATREVLPESAKKADDLLTGRVQTPTAIKNSTAEALDPVKEFKFRSWLDTNGYITSEGAKTGILVKNAKGEWKAATGKEAAELTARYRQFLKDGLTGPAPGIANAGKPRVTPKKGSKGLIGDALAKKNGEQ